MKSVILGQSCKSRCRLSNASIPAANPYSLDIEHVDCVLRGKVKRKPLNDIFNSDLIKPELKYCLLVHSKKGWDWTKQGNGF